MKDLTLLLLFACFCLTCLPATIHENGPDVITVVVEEGRDVILPCLLSTKENVAQTLFDWKKDDQKEVFFYRAGLHYNNGRDGQDEQFKSRVFHFPEELKHGNASIIIRNTRTSDSGNYTCDFPNLQPNQKYHIELAVGPINKDRSGEIKGAAREPCIKILSVTEDGLLLQCKVRDAYPKPEVEWQDSAGNNLTAEEPQVINRGDRYDVTLITTVTKSDHFRCVVRQKEIHHVVFAETFVPFPEKQWIGWLGGSVVGAAILALLLVFLAAIKCITISCNKGSPPQGDGSHVPLKTQPHQNENGESKGVV